MSTSVQDYLRWWFAPSDDPESQARDERIFNALFEANPQMTQQLQEKALALEGEALAAWLLAPETR